MTYREAKMAFSNGILYEILSHKYLEKPAFCPFVGLFPVNYTLSGPLAFLTIPEAFSMLVKNFESKRGCYE